MGLRSHPHYAVGALAALLLWSITCVTTPARGGVTSRVSVASDGTEGNGHSGNSRLSDDGRYVAFQSSATNLVPGDTNGYQDIFVHDRLTAQTTRVSVASDATQGNDVSSSPSISADGRYVAFDSEASNLVADDTNEALDVFVHDRQTGQTTRVSVTSDGAEKLLDSTSPSISADGRYAGFSSWASFAAPANSWEDVFVHDRQTGQTTRVSVTSDGTHGNDCSWSPSLSADGRYVAFYSQASNLVPGDTNGSCDVFVHDRMTGETTRVSVASDGTQGNHDSLFHSISGDGRHVAFWSQASNLVAGDFNGWPDVFVRDRQTGQTARVSVASDGTQGDRWSQSPSISPDGGYVAFDSYASNLVPGDTNEICDAFVHDRVTGQTTRVSLASDGTQGNDWSGSASISGDGRYVAFTSWASNLVPGDTNESRDIFVHDRLCGFTYEPAAPSDQTPVQFSDCSTSPSGQIVAWDWEFGDGGTSTDQNPTHLFAPGTYQVCLTVTDDGDPPSSATCCQVVRVGWAPECCFTYYPLEPYEVTYVDFADCSTDTDGNIASWLWDFDDGSTSTEQNPSHLFVAGPYDVCLTVTDNDGFTDTCCHLVEVWPGGAPLCFTLDGPCWHMITVPCDPVDPDPAAVFAAVGPLLSGNLHRYDRATMGYKTYRDFDPSEFGLVTKGDGYWLYLFEDTTICYDATCPGAVEHFRFEDAGWYLIGSGMPDHIHIICTGWGLGAPGPLTFGDVMDIWVQDPLAGYSCEQGGYYNVGVKPIDDDYYLRAFEGYWMYLFEPDVWMSVPPYDCM